MVSGRLAVEPLMPAGIPPLLFSILTIQTQLWAAGSMPAMMDPIEGASKVVAVVEARSRAVSHLLAELSCVLLDGHVDLRLAKLLQPGDGIRLQPKVH